MPLKRNCNSVDIDVSREVVRGLLTSGTSVRSLLSGVRIALSDPDVLGFKPSVRQLHEISDYFERLLTFIQELETQ